MRKRDEIEGERLWRSQRRFNIGCQIVTVLLGVPIFVLAMRFVEASGEFFGIRVTSQQLLVIAASAAVIYIIHLLEDIRRDIRKIAKQDRGE